MADEKVITLENYNKIEKALDDAQEDTTPFLVMQSDDKLGISGDANRTERKSKCYTIRFRFPSILKDSIPEEINITREAENYVIGEYTVEDVYLSPRKDFIVLSSISKLIPYFNKLNEENGDVTKLEDREKLELIINTDVEILDAMYNVVEAFLQLSKELIDLVLPSSIFETLYLLIQDFPEAFNEADIFFG